MKIDPDVEGVLIDSTTDGSLLFLPPEQLERQLYIKVNKVLEAIGGKWNRKHKAHVFDYDPGDAVDQIILTGEFTDPKKEFQFFETPFEIGTQIVEYAEPNPYDKILEPSAGKGSLCNAIAEYMGVIHGKHREIAHCVEIQEPFRDELQERSDVSVVGEDFLQFNQPYDIIIANPPFSKQQDIDHVNHMLDIAKKRVVSIMSQGTLFRENKKALEFRNRIASLNGDFINLPEGSFKSSGTNVRACVVIANL